MSSTYPQTELVSTTLREGISGYISRAKLENRLYEIFGRKIEVVVSLTMLSPIQAQCEG
jgi:predicted nucleotidyltransferase